jgi:hypothetical protein
MHCADIAAIPLRSQQKTQAQDVGIKNRNQELGNSMTDNSELTIPLLSSLR